MILAFRNRLIDYPFVSNGGKVSPQNFGYHIVPIYNTFSLSLKHENNMQWIEDSLIDSWSWFVFGGDPKPGISYCFKSKIDAGMFLFCRGSENDGLYEL